MVFPVLTCIRQLDQQVTQLTSRAQYFLKTSLTSTEMLSYIFMKHSEQCASAGWASPINKQKHVELFCCWSVKVEHWSKCHANTLMLNKRSICLSCIDSENFIKSKSEYKIKIVKWRWNKIRWNSTDKIVPAVPHLSTRCPQCVSNFRPSPDNHQLSSISQPFFILLSLLFLFISAWD